MGPSTGGGGARPWACGGPRYHPGNTLKFYMQKPCNLMHFWPESGPFQSFLCILPLSQWERRSMRRKILKFYVHFWTSIYCSSHFSCTHNHKVGDYPPVRKVRHQSPGSARDKGSVRWCPTFLNAN